MQGNYILTIEVENETSAMGKDLLVVHSTQRVQNFDSYPTWMICCFLSMFGFCTLATCVKSALNNMIEGALMQVMIRIQNYVHSHQITTKPDENNPIKFDVAASTPAPVSESSASDVDTTGLVKRF